MTFFFAFDMISLFYKLNSIKYCFTFSEMEPNSAGWIGLIILLFITSFGVAWLFVILLGLLVFILGYAFVVTSLEIVNFIFYRCLSLLYMQQSNIERFYLKCAGNPLTANVLNEGGLKEVVRQLESPKKVQKTDSRVTGSELIDSSLQEILGYIIRDYVANWYKVITRDKELIENTVRHSAQTFAINISNR